jgi:hypothetical protein
VSFKKSAKEINGNSSFINKIDLQTKPISSNTIEKKANVVKKNYYLIMIDRASIFSKT